MYVETESIVEEPICLSDYGCDKFGNPITEEGYIDEFGNWVDLTNYKPNKQVIAVVE